MTRRLIDSKWRRGQRTDGVGRFQVAVLARSACEAADQAEYREQGKRDACFHVHPVTMHPAYLVFER
jgi:hypothetical protein